MMHAYACTCTRAHTHTHTEPGARAGKRFQHPPGQWTGEWWAERGGRESLRSQVRKTRSKGTDQAAWG